jgi:nitric oxide reductase NorQ protein
MTRAPETVIVEPRADLAVRAGESFVATPRVQELTDRALTYLAAGYPVHLAGPAGTGKTTLAFHVAAQLSRPVSLLHGNDEFGTSDLIGRDAGYRKSTVVDNYIHSVLKTEERLNVHWVDNRLTTACEEGHTLIYDEFNRTKPEANNILLSILEERILNLPKLGGGDGYIRVHEDFRAIFTSNPEEYAGVHKTQDALLDRLITINVDHYDVETEESITAAKSGLDADQCAYIVAVARTLRSLGSNPHRPTIRGCIAVARILARRGINADPADLFFRTVAWDVFGQGGAMTGVADAQELGRERFEHLLQELHVSTATRRHPPAPSLLEDLVTRSKPRTRGQ